MLNTFFLLTKSDLSSVEGEGFFFHGGESHSSTPSIAHVGNHAIATKRIVVVGSSSTLGQHLQPASASTALGLVQGSPSSEGQGHGAESAVLPGDHAAIRVSSENSSASASRSSGSGFTASGLEAVDCDACGIEWVQARDDGHENTLSHAPMAGTIHQPALAAPTVKVILLSLIL